MKHIKTIALGCKSNERATPENHIVKLDDGNCRAYAALTSQFAPLLYRIQVMNDSGIVKEPYKVCIVIDTEWCNGMKVKDSNSWTVMETIIWLLENYHPPTNGVIFSIYEYEDVYANTIQERWASSSIWPLNESWQAKRDGDYITLHDFQDDLKGSAKYEIARHSGQLDVIDDIDNICKLPVKRVDYTMGEDQIFTLLKHSKMHFTLHGGTYYGAAIINLPTVCFGSFISGDHYHDGFYFKHQKDKGSEIPVSVQHTSWNTGNGNTPTKVSQFDFKTNSVTEHPQRYLRNATSPTELRSYLNGFAMEVDNHYYSIDD